MPATRNATDRVVRRLPVRRLPAPGEEAVALTVLQPVEHHTALLRWCDGFAAGRRPEPHEVVQALLRRLLADPELAADLAADLREGTSADDLAGYVGW